VVVNEVLERPEGIGLDANTSQYVDMMKAGIIDPTKVTRTALENAASIASLMLTTETMVTDIGEEEEGAAVPEGAVR
jgi:chaperonin GroEL